MMIFYLLKTLLVELYGGLQKDVLEKIYAFCAYQERCNQDVIKKLQKLEISPQYYENYLEHLRQERFLDEERFTRSFIRAKLKGNKWGKRKIEFALKQKGISHQLITDGLEKIKLEEYFAVAFAVGEKKLRSIKDTDKWKRKQKLYTYLAQKGFKSNIITNVIDELDID